MATAALIEHGDSEERTRWPAVSKYFPLYEPFWQTHIVTLRDDRGHVRADIDERLELMAQEHYKCFLSVSIALSHEQARPERTFSSLQNAANRAQAVIFNFNGIQTACVPTARPIDDAQAFVTFAKSLAPYRNFVHEDVLGVVADKNNVRYTPLETNWTSTDAGRDSTERTLRISSRWNHISNNAERNSSRSSTSTGNGCLTNPGTF